MNAVTTNIQVTRDHAAVMLGAVRAQQILAREFPSVYPDAAAPMFLATCA